MPGPWSWTLTMQVTSFVWRETDNFPNSGENLIPLSRRLIHTCFSSASSARMSNSSRLRSSFRCFWDHLYSNNRIASRICSLKENVVCPEREERLSILERSSMVVESSDKRLDSSIIMSRYSSRWSYVSWSDFNNFANPRTETIGVLNSWEKLLIKSERNISVQDNSSVMWLKQSDTSRNSAGCSKWILTS